MNHPKPEEWVPYVYGETTGASRRELNAHLQDCPQCRGEVDAWKRSLSRLDAWKLPRAERAPRGSWMLWFRWAAAAAVVLFAGILIGRATTPKVDVESLRLAITPEIRREVSAELAEFAHDEAAKAASFTLASCRSYTDQAVRQVYVAVKKDVDTLAFNTDAGLRNTAQKLVQLADYDPADAPANPNP